MHRPNETPLLRRWFKLLDKTGKADKDRGEVLVDIQFTRNNMTASMFDLSAAGKPRSRLGKIKDKVRGKKKDSDASAGTAPSYPQVMTDSEEEEMEGGRGGEEKEEKKKKKKIKSLFSPKSNLQKNMSQSMSVLPGKNLSLSGSQSSGLNVDPSEGGNSLTHSLAALLFHAQFHASPYFLLPFQVKRSSSSRSTNVRAARTARTPPPPLPTSSRDKASPSSRATCASTALTSTARSRSCRRHGRHVSPPASV